MLSVGASLATGYTAARWNWSRTTTQGVRNGMLAGLVAALVAYPLTAAPAAAVASQSPIFLHGARSAVTDRAAILLICECVVRASWYPYLMFWGLVAGSTLLGGLGGWLAAAQRPVPWGANPPAVVDEGCDTSLAVMVLACWTLVTIIDGRLEGVEIDTLDHTNANAIIAELTQKYGRPTSIERDQEDIDGVPVPDPPSVVDYLEVSA